MEIKSIFTIYQICRLASGVRITPWQMTLQVPFPISHNFKALTTEWDLISGKKYIWGKMRQSKDGVPFSGLKSFKPDNHCLGSCGVSLTTEKLKQVVSLPSGESPRVFLSHGSFQILLCPSISQKQDISQQDCCMTYRYQQLAKAASIPKQILSETN